MIKALSSLTIFTKTSLRSLPYLYANNAIMNKYTNRYFATFTKNDNTQYYEARKMARLMGATYFKFNDEIDYLGDVRLIDDNNKLLGIYNINEARKKTKEMGVDLVLININVKPAICKAYNYKDELYRRFIKEVINKDLNTVPAHKGKKSYSTRLGPNMTLADLKIKVAKTQEISKKIKSVRVYISTTEENHESGLNILSTFKDQSSSFLMPIGIAEEIVYETEGIDDDTQEKLEGDTKTIMQEFSSLIYNEAEAEETKVLSEDEIKLLVKQYFSRQKKQEELFGRLGNLKKEPEYIALKEQIEEESLDYKPYQYYTFQKEEEEDIEERYGYARRIQRLSKKFPEETTPLLDLINEVKSKYGNTKDVNIMKHTLETQAENLTNSIKLMKVVNYIMKNRRKDL